jgi:hypothetical protein
MDSSEEETGKWFRKIAEHKHTPHPPCHAPLATRALFARAHLTVETSRCVPGSGCGARPRRIIVMRKASGAGPLHEP